MNIAYPNTRLRPLLATLLIGCSLATPSFADQPRAMTLLPDGQHHTFETGFNIDNPRHIRTAIRSYQADASAAGMQVKPLELDWSEIEPREGQYDLSETRDRLQEYRDNGWHPLIFLRAVDSDDITVPEYLKGTDEPVALGEIDVSSDRFIARYNALMDQVVPLVRDYGAFAILVANEPDNFLNHAPHLSGQMVDFVTAVRDHIHSLDSDLAVGVALSNGFDHDDDGDRLRAPMPHYLDLIEASDIAVYNFYCQRVAPEDQPASVQARLQSRIDAAKGREVIIQELGCPSGGDPRLSEDFQNGFFEAAYAAMEDTSVRVSVAFQLVDWTEGTIRFYGEALQPLFEAEPAFAENPQLIFVYLDQLSSIGLVNADDGTPKPAWFTYLDAARRAHGAP